jgi:hypothetical protein
MFKAGGLMRKFIEQSKKDAAVPQQKSWRELLAAIHRRRRVLLMATLVFLIVCYPYLGAETAEESLFVKLTTSAVLLVGSYAISRKPWHFVVAILLAIPGLVGRGLTFEFQSRPLDMEIHLASTAFYIFAVVLVLQQVLQSRDVTLDTLAGAVSAYLLIGLTYASLYAVLELLDPHAFAQTVSVEPGGRIFWSNLFFFSFVTLTTLGYGDITPVTPKAQSLAMLEAVTGVFYMGILVAWLVSAFRIGRSLSQTPDRFGKKGDTSSPP